MKVTGIVWLRSVVDKLAWKHDVTTDEVEQVFNRSGRFRFIEKGDVQGEAAPRATLGGRADLVVAERLS